jgi:hypothetical protein
MNIGGGGRSSCLGQWQECCCSGRISSLFIELEEYPNVPVERGGTVTWGKTEKLFFFLISSFALKEAFPKFQRTYVY